VTSFEFHQDLWRRKTSLLRKTDRWMDRRTEVHSTIPYYTYIIASRAENFEHILLFSLS